MTMDWDTDLADSRTIVRALFVIVILISSTLLVNSYVSFTQAESGSSSSAGANDRIDNITVVTTAPDEFTNTSGRIIAFDSSGQVLYSNNTYEKYWDVDPIADDQRTVLYVAGRSLDASECPGAISGPCTINSVEHVNLTTGETTRIYKRYTLHGLWHDVDRVGGSYLLIADISNDRVSLVDLEDGVVRWAWNAQADFPIAGGGSFPTDWTHLNDVERLPDGRIMVSVRNQDQVVLLDRNSGLIEDWTLGADGKHKILNEQHNPDYIPAARGGPSVLVADSGNNRIVEYQRVPGGWARTWIWSDSRLAWPRDADRLPNDHTLITDSNGNRVFEIDARGNRIWSISVDTPYEAERLGTGDESAGGTSAESAGLSSRTNASVTNDDTGGGGSPVKPLFVVSKQAWFAIRGLLPGLLVNALLFVLPPWLSFTDLPVLFLLGFGIVGWVVAEFRWSVYSFRSPIHRTDD